jgi:serine/threonine protein kinase/Tol biopolymer transport system component
VALASGTRLGAYEILTLIGTGGMGEVYRATDTKLHRDIAIKVLPSEVAADPDRLARFDREAQVLASLNHPNIAHIHGVDESAGVPALIMELVEGPTLADRIAKGPIPLDDALPIAKQIAEALEAAHEQGIIHRDLKPTNIKVRPDGTVKVLDFGLAKAFDPTTSAGVNAAMSPTLSIHATQAGIILGTAAYMAPEQARGKPVDRRVDIWAFGCTVFEMLAGKPAFAGETLTDIVAAVVNTEPAWRALPTETPEAVRSVLRRCLQKDPARRLRDVADGRLELEEPPPGPSTSAVAYPQSIASRVLPWALCFALTVGLLVSALTRREAFGDRPISRLDLIVPEGNQHPELFDAEGAAVAISPDGSQVGLVLVRSVERQIYLRRLDAPDMIPLRGTENARVLCFSPDGRSIAFVTSDRNVKTISLRDGLVKVIGSNADNGIVAGLSWTTDDSIIYVSRGGLWEASVRGGAARQLTTPDRQRGEVAHRWPHALPESNGVLFMSTTSSGRDGWRVEVVSTTTGRRQALVDRGTFPVYAASGHLLFVRDGSLLAAPFDVKRVQLTGSPVPVVSNVAVGGAGGAMMTVSRTGSLLTAPVASADRLVWVSRGGDETEFGRTPPGIVRFPRIAPDGRRVALSIDATDVWVIDSVREASTRLTSGQVTGGNILWTPDGRQILFVTSQGLQAMEASGGATGQPLPSSSPSESLGSISPDGRELAVLRYGQETGPDVYEVPLSGASTARPLLNGPFFEGGPQFSPDGRWLAYVSNETGRFEVYIRPYPALDRKWPVSTGGGTAPIWNRNGRELFYRNGAKMISVAVSPESDLLFSTPTVLFERPYSYGTGVTVANYDVSADGQRFLMVKEEAGGARVHVTLNFFDELKRLAPTR